jgi:hypothetical protein
MKPDDYVEDHWENMKRLIAFETKQNEIMINRAMLVLVSTLNHSSHSGEIRVIG